MADRRTALLDRRRSGTRVELDAELEQAGFEILVREERFAGPGYGRELTTYARRW